MSRVSPAAEPVSLAPSNAVAWRAGEANLIQFKLDLPPDLVRNGRFRIP